MSRYNEHYTRDLRSKLNASSHNRKRKSEHVPMMDDAPKRRRTWEDKGNVTRPISFKELEKISRESSPALKLISKAERFEALLVSEKLSNEESNPEFLKLVISAFHLLYAQQTTSSPKTSTGFYVLLLQRISLQERFYRVLSTKCLMLTTGKTKMIVFAQ